MQDWYWRHSRYLFSFRTERSDVFAVLSRKSQIRALDRTQPGLPMKKGRCATMTHD
jgi:hypothetical protein